MTLYNPPNSVIVVIQMYQILWIKFEAVEYAFDNEGLAWTFDPNQETACQLPISLYLFTLEILIHKI